MSMSDCSKCWSTPCLCGYEYKQYSIGYFAKFISNILHYKTKDEAEEILKKAITEVQNDRNWYNEK